MKRSTCSPIGSSSGQVLTVDPALIQISTFKCSECRKPLDLAGIIEDIIAGATTGVLNFPKTGRYPVVLNYAENGRPLSLQIMLPD